MITVNFLMARPKLLITRGASLPISRNNFTLFLSTQSSDLPPDAYVMHHSRNSSA